MGRLSELTDGSGNLIVQYTYDAAGNLIQKDNGNGTFTIYTYDGDADVLSITNYAPSTGSTSYVPANSTVNSFDDYTYDALGNVLTDTSQDGEWVYNYDADSQLVQAVFTPNSTDPDGLTAQDLQYVYDAAGNRISETVNGVTTTYVTNNVNEYTSSMTDGVTTSYQYDADGNLIAQSVGGSTTTYTFNELNELTAVNGPDVTASYAYNPLGNLISQTVNGVATNFQIDPVGLGNVVAAYDGGTLLAHYTYGVGLVSQVSAAGIAGYYDFNNVGNTVGMTDATGRYVDQYSYLPFGQTTKTTATVANPFTFEAEFGDLSNAAGSFSLRFRSYNPSTGQFDSSDPIGLAAGSTNLRQYASNDPVTLVDPSGLCFLNLGLSGGYLLGASVSLLVDENGEEYLSLMGGATTPGVGYGLTHSPGRASEGWGAQFSAGLPILGPFVGVTSSLDIAFDQITLEAGLGVGLFSKYDFGLSFMVGYTWDLHRTAPHGLKAPCFHDLPPSILPTPPGKNGGSNTVDGQCTVLIGGVSDYVCLDNDVYSKFEAPISIPGRDCSAQAVASALAESFTSGMLAGTGGGVVPPAVVSTENCNPQINNILQPTEQAKSDASDPPINTAPAVTGTDQAANVAGLTNANLRGYTDGDNFPVAPTTITVGGVDFALVPDGTAADSLGVLQTTGSGTSFDIPVNIVGATIGYTLINSTYGEVGDTVGTVEFKGTNGADAIFDLVEGTNIRDYENDAYNNTVAAGTPSAVYGNGQTRLDMQTFVLPASFANARLTDIILTSTGGTPQGNPFLAAATVATSSGPSQFVLLGPLNNESPPPNNGSPPPNNGSPPPNNKSPLTFFDTGLGNLGLPNGQGGNAQGPGGNAQGPGGNAQMVSTIAKFDQTEADLAGIFETASGNGASLGITGDLNLLQTIDARLIAVTTAENLLFGGDANWLDTKQVATLQQWLTAFFADAQASSDGTISAAEITQLLATTLAQQCFHQRSDGVPRSLESDSAILEPGNLHRRPGSCRAEHRFPRPGRDPDRLQRGRDTPSRRARSMATATSAPKRKRTWRRWKATWRAKASARR